MLAPLTACPMSYVLPQRTFIFTFLLTSRVFMPPHDLLARVGQICLEQREQLEAGPERVSWREEAGRAGSSTLGWQDSRQGECSRVLLPGCGPEPPLAPGCTGVLPAETRCILAGSRAQVLIEASSASQTRLAGSPCWPSGPRMVQ